MKNARLFRNNKALELVSAEDVKNGKYSRNEEFIDPEYEYKVQYVKGARNNGEPYFRLYHAYEEYKKLYPDRASRYEIVANMRRYQESAWHKKWKKNVASFCDIEKTIKNNETNKWKFADAFYEDTQTCIEFQHSYIDWDFEERNKFYSNLSIKTIWLYDLPNANARESESGFIEILEDNARGFFKISENPDNLKDHYVYIQVKSGKIYRVCELHRHDTSSDKKYTIRYFAPTEVYTEDEFITAIKNNTIGNTTYITIPKSLHELWKSTYSSMTVRNVEKNKVIRINRDGEGNMFRRFGNRCIQYKYDDNYRTLKKDYSISRKDEYRPIWVLVNKRLYNK